MVDEEYLEEIIKQRDHVLTDYFEGVPVLELTQINWLIKKALHALHLEMKYENTGSMFGRQAQQTLIDENKRLRESLDFIANTNKDGLTHQWHVEEFRYIARKTLEDKQ